MSIARFMQPWNFIVIRDEAIRRAVHDGFLAGLGRQTDPATDLYSTVCAVQDLLKRPIHFDRWGVQDEQRASALLAAE